MACEDKCSGLLHQGCRFGQNSLPPFQQIPTHPHQNPKDGKEQGWHKALQALFRGKDPSQDYLEVCRLRDPSLHQAIGGGEYIIRNTFCVMAFGVGFASCTQEVL